MIGNASTPAQLRTSWLARAGLRPQRYIAIDGGAGAHLLAALAGFDPALQPVAAPRHADLLIVVGPIAAKLVPAINEVLRVLPRPAHALLVGTEPGPAPLDPAHVPGVRWVAPELRDIVAAARASASTPGLRVSDPPSPETPPIPLPSKRKRELATELAVLSFGPLQAWTAGPLRVLLVCDGEQVVSVQLETGYAERGIAQRITGADWHAAADLAARLDPLAPVASQLVFVQALEQLAGVQVETGVVQQRAAALAMERAHNYLWWFVRFARLLVHVPLAVRAYELASRLSVFNALLPLPASGAGGALPPSDAHGATALRRLADDVAVFAARVARDRALLLRTRGVGVVGPDRLQAAHVTGPVLTASACGAGDVASRVTTRLSAAVADLRAATDILAPHPAASSPIPQAIPAGEAHAQVPGPRGQLALRLLSTGTDRVRSFAWQSSSAVLLTLLPDMLVGQTLADAQVIIASLDLAMAEADG